MLTPIIWWSASTAYGQEQDPRRWLVPTAHSAGTLFVLRLSCSAMWPGTFDVRRVGRNWDTFRGSWTSAPTWRGDAAFFQWDGDPWALNLVGHSVMGSELYLRHRQGLGSWWIALGMTVAWTLVWEFFIEGWHKHPSGIDLAWTPTGGALLGEGRYQLLRLIRRLDPSPGRRLLLYLVDPLGQAERDLFGLKF